ncbi:triose-phosphate isomerase (plasmid) [Sphingomonas paeninsulae]|uniref:Triosephosphate isomerase n=1 Tax=Sphingomonas paeninsulae TaxID=2319844 RepID=A0A494T5B0_SPHPE|nr:triose-phosphate isomerase [Sphingomonas paeninsulae]AYJ84569.1 triose-phosphate isomerase [Sphingomonas paeninsulae]
MRTLIAGNWKMHGLQAQIGEIAAMARANAGGPSDVEVLVCVPATLIAHAVQAADGVIQIGGEDCSAEEAGPFTGDIDAQMLRDAGATSVILGHSERRQGHHETDATVAAKVKAAWRHGLATIVCIGETQAQRHDGNALKVCGDQLAASLPDIPAGACTSVAYEPLWAIGSGTMPTREQIIGVLGHLRAALDERFGSTSQSIRILYGGSVKSENALEILDTPDVNGVLIGGASLLAHDFNAIVDVARGRTPTGSV